MVQPLANDARHAGVDIRAGAIVRDRAAVEQDPDVARAARRRAEDEVGVLAEDRCVDGGVGARRGGDLVLVPGPDS